MDLWLEFKVLGWGYVAIWKKSPYPSCVVLSLDVALSLGVVTIEWNCRTPSQYLKPLLGVDETHLHRALMTRIVA